MKCKSEHADQATAEQGEKKLVDANMRALSTSWAPSFRLILLPAPCPNIKPKALMIAIKSEHNPGGTTDAGSQLADKKGIRHVVNAGDQHTDGGRKPKLQYQLMDGVSFCHIVVVHYLYS